MNYEHTPQDYQELVNLGIPHAEVNGYQITDGDQQALNEFYSNQREMGFEVPEEYQPIQISRAELEMRYQELSMFETEGDRVNKDSEDGLSIWERAGYEEEELCFDKTKQDYVPDWLFNFRRDMERRENKHNQTRKIWTKKKRNDESSKKLVALLKKKEEEREKRKKENLEKSRKIVESLKEKGIE